jgi:hypothetical protein
MDSQPPMLKPFRCRRPRIQSPSHFLTFRLRYRRFTPSANSGITIVEALMAAVIVAVVGSMAAVAGNSIISFIYRTDEIAQINAIIDNDLARIREIGQSYNSCTNPAGSLETTGCTDISGGVIEALNSYYYFPGTAANVADFELACRSTNSATHLTANFISLIDDPPQSNDAISSKITKSVSREQASNADNYNVVINYAAPNSIKRRVVVTPYLSYWCPS